MTLERVTELAEEMLKAERNMTSMQMRPYSCDSKEDAEFRVAYDLAQIRVQWAREKYNTALRTLANQS
jgi:hypothetical protein